jgi:hypothetical protein
VQELRDVWLCRVRSGVGRAHLRHSNFAQGVSESTMTVTCNVVEAQNVLRKMFIAYSKHAFSIGINAEQALASIVDDICHPAGVAFDARSWPPSWALDMHEAPTRERRRMCATHLAIDERYLLAGERAKLAAERVPAPLSTLLSMAQYTLAPPRHKESSVETRSTRGETLLIHQHLFSILRRRDGE